MSGVGQEQHGGGGKTGAHGRVFTWFAARILAAVNEQGRSGQQREPPRIEVLGGALGGGCQVEPGLAIEAKHATPARAMVQIESRPETFAKGVRSRRHTFKERARARFASIEMEGLQDHRVDPIRPFDGSDGGNDGTIAMAPPHGLLDAKRVQKGDRFLSCSTVKVDRKGGNGTRDTMSRAIRNEDPILTVQHPCLGIERKRPIAPPTVEEDHRAAASAGLAIRDRCRTTDKGGRIDANGRHAPRVLSRPIGPGGERPIGARLPQTKFSRCGLETSWSGAEIVAGIV
jgi:hypothetical protein